MEAENKEMWKSFNAFPMSDIESSKEGKVNRTIEWKREKVNEWWRILMKRWEKEGVMEIHLQEHQMWNLSILQKMGMVLELWLIQAWTQS